MAISKGWTLVLPSESNSLPGTVIVPGTTRRLNALLRWTDDGRFELFEADGEQGVDEGGPALRTGRDIRRERIAGGPWLFHLGDDWVFSAKTDQAPNTLPGYEPQGWLSSLEEWHPRLVAAILVGIAGIWLIWRYGLDILVAGAVAMTPAPFIDLIDDGNLSALDATIASESELPASEQARVAEIFERLKAAMPVDEAETLTLEFRQMGESIGPNAFALPGGTMLVTDALVKQFPSEDLLAGVIGHEIAHVTEQHGLKRVYRSLSVFLLVSLMAGDVGPFVEDLLLEGGVLLSLSYSRHQESEADAHGAELAAAAGFDPAALALFFEALESQGAGEGPKWLSTHPDFNERVSDIRKRAEDLRAQ